MDTLLRNPHAGVILMDEFLEPLKMTQYRLAKLIHVAPTRVAEIVKGQRAISSDTALRLGRLFGTTPDVWLNLQASYNLAEARKAISTDLERIEPLIIEAAA